MIINVFSSMLKLQVYEFWPFLAISLEAKNPVLMPKSKHLPPIKESNLTKDLISLAKSMSMAVMLIHFGIIWRKNKEGPSLMPSNGISPNLLLTKKDNLWQDLVPWMILFLKWKNPLKNSFKKLWCSNEIHTQPTT